MKFQASELPIGKPQPRRKTSRLAPLVALIILLTIPLYYPALRDTSKKLYETTSVVPYEDLEDPISLTSHVEEPPPPENPKDPCSADPAHCHHDKAAGDTAVDHHLAPVRKKNDKGRRKRMRKPRSEAQKDSAPQGTGRQAISRSDDQGDKVKAMMSGRSSYRGAIRSRVSDEEQCDLFSGEWVANPDGPYYTNDTCNAIQEHQNCLKFGRPDRGFLQWRWKPDDCELPLFEPHQFLQLLKGKSLAFVGDSVARNHMQSLICLLSKVANPVDLSNPLDQNKRYEYREHDFNISMLWSPYLVKTEKSDPNDDRRPFRLFLDQPDLHWSSQIALFDYVVISAGHWFFRPTYFHLRTRLVGCLYCPEPDVAHLTSFFSYRRAFRTTFRAIADAGFGGVAFLRTYAPSHFEGAAWDKGGDCARTRPYRRSEVALEDYSLEMYLIQLEELRIAQKAGRRSRGKFKLFDATVAMLLRPDGHPSKYGHWPAPNQTFANDCVHWCLPGPIDAWNDFLLELLKREIGEDR
ncbi:protein trichome birefringence-like 19 [Salvia miltiorrhiza]|uniref:protein trichome birefringence-like 19 n=1 Tax=Salvia miltiorrhiza TaxID=226208 RepID=UPI0025ACA196|nr:protein trichome birefringence-like 19 [Salvia miltiorrhiza]